MNSLFQGAENELHTSKNSAMLKSPKANSFQSFLHIFILSFMSLSNILFIDNQSVSLTETWEKEVSASDPIRHRKECMWKSQAAMSHKSLQL